LFRQEVILAATGDKFGEPFGKAPLGWSIISLLLIGITASAGVFLATATYARKETARGLLRADGGETRILAQAGGAVRALYVREGERVEKGQVLALIATEVALPGGGVMDETMLAALAAEAATIATRLAALDAGAPLEAASLRAELQRLQAERQAAQGAIATTTARLDLAQERLAAGTAIAARGHLPADLLRERQSAVIALEEALGRARADVAALAAQEAGLAARLAKLPHDLALTRAQLEAQAASLTQQRAQLEGRRGYELRAPQAGRITALQASLGQAIDPTKPLMTLTPEAGALRAELYAPSRAIGFVRPGQRVRLLYDAFPYQKFGPAWGVVQAVSATVLAPTEVTAAVPVEEPVYRITARLEAQSLRAFGAETPLQPGMALTADVILEERSFAEWLLEPLLALKARGGGVPARAAPEPTPPSTEPLDLAGAQAPPPHPHQPPPEG